MSHSISSHLSPSIPLVCEQKLRAASDWLKTKTIRPKIEMALSLSLVSTSCGHPDAVVDSHSVNAHPLIDVSQLHISPCFSVLIGGGILYGALIAHGRWSYLKYKPLILEALKERSKDGLELRKELNVGTNIYPVLRQMERQGYIRSEIRDENLENRGGRPRTYYRLAGSPRQNHNFAEWFADYHPSLIPG